MNWNKTENFKKSVEKWEKIIFQIKQKLADSTYILDIQSSTCGFCDEFLNRAKDTNILTCGKCPLFNSKPQRICAWYTHRALGMNTTYRRFLSALNTLKYEKALKYAEQILEEINKYAP
jgi:hypothetical protein